MPEINQVGDLWSVSRSLTYSKLTWSIFLRRIACISVAETFMLLAIQIVLVICQHGRSCVGLQLPCIRNNCEYGLFLFKTSALEHEENQTALKKEFGLQDVDSRDCIYVKKGNVNGSLDVCNVFSAVCRILSCLQTSSKTKKPAQRHYDRSVVSQFRYSVGVMYTKKWGRLWCLCWCML